MLLPSGAAPPSFCAAGRDTANLHAGAAAEWTGAMNPITKRYEVSADDFTRAGEASGKVKRTLKQLGYDPDAIRRVAIAMYEAEINMVIHANGGTVEVSIYPDRVEVLLTDQGPGITDVDLAMQEGYSTAPDEVRALGFGAGMGLPNIKKYTDDMHIESEVGVGTKIYMTIQAEGGRSAVQ